MEAHLESHGAGRQSLRVICLPGNLFYQNSAAVEATGFEHWKDGERKLILSHTALAGRHCESTYQGTRCIQIRRLLRQTGF